MKVIKVGNGAQSRIAQACDRCRSKKIRCDGVRPTCSQCASVGFECKTSDKLSRRAFPRGYTESLEERVRSLESEVRDLKGLLDERDEKIDVLSRIRSFSPPSAKLPSPASVSSLSHPSPTCKLSHTSAVGDDLIHVSHNSCLHDSLPGAHAPLTDLSSTRSFVGKCHLSTCSPSLLWKISVLIAGYSEAFINKLVNEEKLAPHVSTRALMSIPPPLSHAQHPPIETKTPPRIVSDQLINIFFQEWAPLYPVVHRPTILKAYEQYLGMSVTLPGESHEMAQLNLIFGIAALSSKVC